MYKVEALKTFQNKDKKLVQKGKIFDTDKKYASQLVNYGLVKILQIEEEKKLVEKSEIIKIEKPRRKYTTKVVDKYQKKIIVPKENKGKYLHN